MAETSLSSKRARFNKLRHHVLRENHTSLLRSHTRIKKLVIRLLRLNHGLLQDFAALALNRIIHGIHLITALLLIGRTCTELRRTLKSGRTINLATAHLIASKPDRVTKPLASQKDRHLDTKACLRVKERGHMVVLQELRNELFIGRREFLALLGKANTSRVDNREIIAKGLKKLNRTGLEERHIFFSWLPSK